MASTLLSIARCLNVDLCGDTRHPCATVLGAQTLVRRDAFQVPEPWRGDIASAPLLFVASNPSWDATDDSPTWSSSDAHILSYYQQGFPSVFPKILRADGTSSPGYVRFWAAIRARAAELYRVEASTLKPGQDFAITEVVHCKSRNELGVQAAISECVKMHWESTMRVAGARVVVVLGDVARRALLLESASMPQRCDWFGRSRYVAWLPHPNARKKRKFSDCYTAEQLESLHEALSQLT